MDTLKKNRKAATVCLILAVILCIPLGTYRSISSLEHKVEKEYAEKDKYGETVEGTLEMLRYHITVFADEYEKALSANDTSRALRKNAETLGESAVSKEPSEPDQLRATVTSMKSELERREMYSDAARAAFVSIDSDISILKKYDSYNKAAGKYNDVANSMIGKLFNMGTAVEF